MKSIKQIRVITFILAIIVACNIYIPVKTEAAGTIYWPVPGHTSLTQGYGWNGSSGHKGIDISDGSIAGASVVASVGGYVDAIYLCPTQHNGSYGDCLGFGTGLIIRGDDGRY